MNKNAFIVVLVILLCITLWSQSYYKKEAAYWKNKYATCAVNKDLRNLNNPPSNTDL